MSTPPIVAVVGALLCVLTGCIGSKAAIRSIEWETILLFGAMFAVAAGIESSGAGMMIAGGIRLVLGPEPPGWLVLTSVFLTATLLGTEPRLGNLRHEPAEGAGEGQRVRMLIRIDYTTAGVV